MVRQKTKLYRNMDAFLKIIPAGTYIYTLKKEAFMIGAIIGDLVGSVFEFNDFKQYDFPLVSKESRITDDSCIGRSGIETKGESF